MAGRVRRTDGCLTYSAFLAVMGIIVPKDSTIQTVAELRGKTIAVPQGSSAHGLALLSLKNAGLTPDDVKLDFLDPAPGAAAFNSGKVDAWAIWEPQITLARKNGARVLVAGLPPNDQVTSYFAASEKALDDPSRKARTDVYYRIALEYQYEQLLPPNFDSRNLDTGGYPKT